MAATKIISRLEFVWLDDGVLRHNVAIFFPEGAFGFDFLLHCSTSIFVLGCFHLTLLCMTMPVGTLQESGNQQDGHPRGLTER